METYLASKGAHNLEFTFEEGTAIWLTFEAITPEVSGVSLADIKDFDERIVNAVKAAQ